MDPLPMHGRDLGVSPDDLVETPEVEQEAKQEILENKDVSLHTTKAETVTGDTLFPLKQENKNKSAFL